MGRRAVVVPLLVALALTGAPKGQSQRPITSPKQAFGFNLGDDYHLANYKQIESYWKMLARESDRLVLHDMGKTAEGRTQWMAVVRTIPQLRAFVEGGGTIVALSDSAMHLAEQFRLPVENHLVENSAPLPRATFFVPGSVLTARVDTRHPLAAGMPEHADFFFDNSPVFRLRPGATSAGVRSIAMFDTAAPLHSGWAWGQKRHVQVVVQCAVSVSDQ